MTASTIATSAASEGDGPDVNLRREHGQRAVFCGLTSIIWLHRKIQDAFFLVVGSRTCAHLIQSAAGVMIFAEPRFGTAILQERDLAGMADCHDELDRMIEEVLSRRPNLKTVFLVSSCPSEVIKLDLGNAAERLQRQYAGKHRFIAYSGSGIETTFTQGEDSCLASLSVDMPAAEDATPSLLVVGTLPDIVEDQFCRLFNAMGIERVAFYPRQSSEGLPEVGANTHVLLAQPYLSETTRALAGRGAQVISAPFPYGEEGTSAWFAAAAKAMGVQPALVAEVLAPAQSRAQTALARYRKELSGKSVAFLPDSQLEIPLARFLARECGMKVLEVGTPYFDAGMMSEELPWLPEGVEWTEGQDLDVGLDRIREKRPDLTVCGLGIANPLEAEGLRTKWSIELLFSPVQGFDQAADLAELFSRPLRRERQLSVGSWS